MPAPPGPVSTPSPASTAATPSHSNSASRRPPRKSTLTQQQKLQKRQRATQDQLITLEVEFNKNPTPHRRRARAHRFRDRHDGAFCPDLVPEQVSLLRDAQPMLALTCDPQTRQNQEHCQEEHRERRGLQRHPRVDAAVPGPPGHGVWQKPRQRLSRAPRLPVRRRHAPEH